MKIAFYGSSLLSSYWNGAATYYRGILRALGCQVVELYSEVDGDFPNHHPDPSKPENLAELIRTRFKDFAKQIAHQLRLTSYLFGERASAHPLQRC